MYYTGVGGTQDIQRAREWFKKATQKVMLRLKKS